jgi:hypothetical protein
MKRAILASIGWCMAGGVLYGSVLALDLHWNLFTWAPELDLNSLLLFCGVAIGTGLAWGGAKYSHSNMSRGIGVLVSLFLACAALYATKPEPVQLEGALPRRAASPVWYRWSRAVLMCLPGTFLYRRCRGNKKAAPSATQPGAADKNRFTVNRR